MHQFPGETIDGKPNGPRCGSEAHFVNDFFIRNSIKFGISFYAIRSLFITSYEF